MSRLGHCGRSISSDKSRRRRKGNVCGVRKPRPLDSIAAAQAELLENDRRRAESGERRLNHVEPGKGRRQVPVSTDPIAQREAEQDGKSREGENRFVDV